MNATQTERQNPNATRKRLLDFAFAEIHRQGYHGMRVNTVLEKAGLTKGAIYHHFPDKRALGYAVVDEVIAGFIHEIWVRTLEQESDIATAISKAFERAIQTEGFNVWQYGCPLNNLALEMSPIDDGFRTRTTRVFRQWRSALAGALERGKKNGTIAADTDSEAAAIFIIATLEGGMALAKNEGDAALMEPCMAGLLRYLDTLKP